MDKVTIVERLEGEQVDVRDSIVGMAQGQNASVTDSIAGGVVAGADMDAGSVVAMGIVAGRDMRVASAGAMAMIAGRDFSLDSGGAAYMRARTANVHNAKIGVLLAAKAELSEDTQVVLDTPQAIGLGVAFGVAAALTAFVLGLVGRRRE